MQLSISLLVSVVLPSGIMIRCSDSAAENDALFLSCPHWLLHVCNCQRPSWCQSWSQNPSQYRFGRKTLDNPSKLRRSSSAAHYDPSNLRSQIGQPRLAAGLRGDTEMSSKSFSEHPPENTCNISHTAESHRVQFCQLPPCLQVTIFGSLSSPFGHCDGVARSFFRN